MRRFLSTIYAVADFKKSKLSLWSSLHSPLFSFLCLIGQLTASSSILHLAEVIHHSFHLPLFPFIHILLLLSLFLYQDIWQQTRQFLLKWTWRGKKTFLICLICKNNTFLNHFFDINFTFSLHLKSVSPWQKAFSGRSIAAVIGKESWFSHSIHSVLSDHHWCIILYTSTQ